jgi:hypothetical protein
LGSVKLAKLANLAGSLAALGVLATGCGTGDDQNARAARAILSLIARNGPASTLDYSGHGGTIAERTR